MAAEECVLGALPGTGGVELFTDSSMGKLPLLTTKKFPELDVPPDAPGLLTETATAPAAVSADAGTWTINVEMAAEEG
jgi:hypothetical protein